MEAKDHLRMQAQIWKCEARAQAAIEVFPADADVVNVANMRHLWVMAEPIQCAWRKTPNGPHEGPSGASREGPR